MPSRKPLKTKDEETTVPVGIACPGKDLLQAFAWSDLLMGLLKTGFGGTGPNEPFQSQDVLGGYSAFSGERPPASFFNLES
jgi:hypothetical protein